MDPFIQNYENCCLITKSSSRRALPLVAKWKAFFIGRNGPREFCGRKALKHPMFIVGVERKHLQAECVRVGMELKMRLSMSGVVTPRKNGFVTPFGSSQGDGSDV